MVSKRMWVVINISLSFLAIFLLLTFLGFKMPTMGQAFYALDKEPAYCLTSFQDQYHLADPDICCLEIQQQLVKAEPYIQTLSVDGQQVEVNKKYYTSENTIQYLINQKAYHYCKNNGFLV